MATPVLAQSSERLIVAGDGVVTGFPGFVAKVPPGQPENDARFRFIDERAASARVQRLARPGFIWDGRAWNAPEALAIPAGRIGLVFGVTLDDEAFIRFIECVVNKNISCFHFFLVILGVLQ